MNLSPSKIVSQLNPHQPHQLKPRVAFTYQISQLSNPNNPLQVTTNQMCPNSKTHQTNGQVIVGSVASAYGTNKNMCTPKKISEKDKQNSQISQNKKPENKTITNIETNVCKNNQVPPQRYANQNKQYISNFTLNNPRNTSVSKQKQPRLAFPPVSPKNTGKKVHNRTKTGSTSNQNTLLNNLSTKSKCPSFLAQKHKNQQTVDQNTSNKAITNFTQDKKSTLGQSGRHCKCGEIATHKYDTKDPCCYKCGINKMFQGHELSPLEINNINIKVHSPTQRNHQPNDIKQIETQKHPAKSQILSKIVQNQSSSLTSQKLLKQIEDQKKSLIKFYKQSLQTQNQNIKTFYKQRKLQLRNHYQKIKSALKVSIEQDLCQLQLMEKQQINQWKKSINLMQDDLKKLQKIQNKVKQSISGSLGNQKKVKKQFIQEYQEIIAKTKHDNKPWRVSKLQGQADTMNLSGISNLTSQNISGLNITILLKNFNVNAQVYKPELYRMVGCPIKSQLSSPRPSDLGCQLNQQPGYQSRYEQCVEQHNIEIDKQNKNTQMRNNKAVLFSFQSKKC